MRDHVYFFVSVEVEEDVHVKTKVISQNIFEKHDEKEIEQVQKVTVSQVSKRLSHKRSCKVIPELCQHEA